jgi:GT2 family glycosyltransferase
MEKIKNHFNYTVTGDPLNFSSVEIVIPFHGQTAHVANLLESIFRTVRDTRYLITLIDDFSPNKEFLPSVLKANIPGVRGIRNFQHSGFGYSINQALNNPFSKDIPWIVVMHSDVLAVKPAWLLNLVKALHSLKDQNVKMVTSLTDNPTNNLSRLKCEKSEKLEDFILNEDEFIPMYSCIAHRELYLRLNGMMECPFAGSEAREFARRMRKNGYFQAACGNSWVHHEGGVSLSPFKKDEKVQERLLDVEKKLFSDAKLPTL